MEKPDVDKVFKEYGLEVEEVESSGYKVLNIDKEISIDELQWDLKSCIIIASDKTGYKKLPFGGINSTLAHVYYIITDFDKYDLGYKYNKLATQQYGKSYYMDYKYRPELANRIDTIYSEREI